MAESILDIIFRTKKTGDGEKQTTSGLKGAATAFQDLTGVSLTAAGAFGLVAAGLRKAVTAAAEGEKVNAQLNAVLESTGFAAGMSADELDRLASTMMQQTAVDDELIKSGEAVMLTFTRIGEEVFPEAMMAALNMSSALGQDLQSSVIQLGKALNDPIQGVTALRRVGVSFTAEQLEMIRALQETGDLMGAQKIILAELSTEFGGQAAAAANTYSGQLELLNNNLDNIAQSIGQQLIPWLAKATTTLNIMITAADQINAALEQQGEALVLSTSSYEEYVDSMTWAAKAAGKVVQVIDGQAQVFEIGANGMMRYSEGFQILSAFEWTAAQAADEMNRAQQETAQTAEEAQGPVSGLAGQFGALAGEAGLAATSAHEMAGAAERLATAESNLQSAQENLATAQENWRSGAGGQIAGMLEATGLAAEELYPAIDATDEIMGTNEGTAIRQKDAMQKLVDEYKRTGDIDAFKEGLVLLNDTFQPLNQSVIDATALVETLQAKLEEIGGHIYTATVRVNYEDSGGPGGGGGGGGNQNDCFLAGTPVTTPDGLRPIEEIRLGDLVSVLTIAGVVSAPVVWRKVSQRNDLVTVKTSDGQEITCSPNHPWLTQESGFVWAEDLRAGEALVSDHGIVTVVLVKPCPGLYTIYNFTIDHPDHTFMVGGIVVHNVEYKDSGGDLYRGRVYIAGEEGPEPVVVAPNGAIAGHVYPNEALAAGGVTIQQVVINNGMDVEELIYEINRRTRR